jgi:hypothetical protein
LNVVTAAIMSTAAGTKCFAIRFLPHSISWRQYQLDQALLNCLFKMAAVSAGSPEQLAQLTYWDRNPPYAVIALAQEASIDLPHAADPKATKETTAKLQFPTGCGWLIAVCSVR